MADCQVLRESLFLLNSDRSCGHCRVSTEQDLTACEAPVSVKFQNIQCRISNVEYRVSNIECRMHFERSLMGVENSGLDILNLSIFLNADSYCEYLQKGWLSGLIKPIFAHDYFDVSGGR